METCDLILEINKLPVSERLALIEKIIKTIPGEEKNERMKQAAELLYNDYLNEKDLTAFTSLDGEDFRELGKSTY